MQADLWVFLHEFQEVLSLHKREVAGRCRFGSGFVTRPRNGGTQSQRFPGARSLQDQNLALAGCGGKMNSS